MDHPEEYLIIGFFNAGGSLKRASVTRTTDLPISTSKSHRDGAEALVFIVATG